MEESKQDQSKRDALARGEAFTRLIREDGWSFIKKYFELRLQAFASQLLVSDKPIIEFERERQELVGIRKLFGFVDGDIKTYEESSRVTKK